MGERTVGVGVIGCGRVAVDRHLPVLARLPGSRLVGIAEPEPERRARVARMFGARRAHAGAAELLADAEVEAVVVATPPATHAALAIEALGAGKHVLLEKPPTLTLAECDRVAEAAARAGRTVAVGLAMRFHPLVREAARLREAGRLGEVTLARAACTSAIRPRGHLPAWRSRTESGGGVLLELGINHLDLVPALLGEPAVEVFAQVPPGPGPEESAALLLRMASGASATLVLGEATADGNDFELFGSRGRLRVALYQVDGLELLETFRYPSHPSVRLEGLLRFFRQAAVQAVRGSFWTESYRGEWRSFLSAVRTGAAPEVGLREGRQALAAVEAARESVRTGRPVALPLPRNHR